MPKGTYIQAARSDIEIVLQQHKLFVDTRGQEGHRANLNSIDIAAANFAPEELKPFTLSDADLQGANLSGMTFNAMNFELADLREANLEESCGTTCRFVKAKLQDSSCAGFKSVLGKFMGANLRNASFRGAKLANADFRGCNLRGTDFSKASLNQASFIGAEIYAANFHGADLRGANFHQTKYDIATRLHIEKVATGAVFHTDKSEFNFQGEIRFPAIYADAAFSILEYFRTYVAEKFINKNIYVRIVQRGSAFTLIIETPEGELVDQMTKAFVDYIVSVPQMINNLPLDNCSREAVQGIARYITENITARFLRIEEAISANSMAVHQQHEEINAQLMILGDNMKEKDNIFKGLGKHQADAVSDMAAATKHVAQANLIQAKALDKAIDEFREIRGLLVSANAEQQALITNLVQKPTLDEVPLEVQEQAKEVILKQPSDNRKKILDAAFRVGEKVSGNALTQIIKSLLGS